MDNSKPPRAEIPNSRWLQPESHRAYQLRETAERLTAQFEKLASEEALAKGLPRRVLLDYVAAIVHQRFLERRVS